MKKKSIALNLLIVLFSSVISLLCTEFVFRAIIFNKYGVFEKLKDPGLYSNHILHDNEDFYNDDYWKLYSKFHPLKGINNLHPLLGWTGQFDPNSFRHNDEDNLMFRRPVLLYGNSFSICVDTVDCFQQILNGDKEFADKYYMLNYGVGGYGVDQIYLLMDQSAHLYDKPFIVAGLLTTDMDRCLLDFRIAPKPRFIKTENGLELKKIGKYNSIEDYLEKNPPEINSYVLNRLRRTWLNPYRNDSTVEANYISRIKSVNSAILDSIVTTIKSINTDFIFLIFQPEYHSEDDWRLNFLRQYCEENNLPHIIEREIRINDIEKQGFSSEKYSIPGDGHPTSYLNSLISEVLKNKILQADSGKELYSLKKEELKFRNQILANRDWLNSVKLKAAQSGLTLGSQLTLDAKYLVWEASRKSRND